MKEMVSEREFDWAREGNFKALIEFFKNGGDVNYKNHEGHSLLMVAASNDHWGLCYWLIRNGADVNAIDLSGNTILMAACLRGFGRIVRLLLSFGADPFIQNAYGLTAMDYAKSFKHDEVIHVLSGDHLFH